MKRNNAGFVLLAVLAIIVAMTGIALIFLWFLAPVVIRNEKVVTVSEQKAELIPGTIVSTAAYDKKYVEMSQMIEDMDRLKKTLDEFRKNIKENPATEPDLILARNNKVKPVKDIFNKLATRYNLLVTMTGGVFSIPHGEVDSGLNKGEKILPAWVNPLPEEFLITEIRDYWGIDNRGERGAPRQEFAPSTRPNSDVAYTSPGRPNLGPNTSPSSWSGGPISSPSRPVNEIMFERLAKPR